MVNAMVKGGEVKCCFWGSNTYLKRLGLWVLIIVRGCVLNVGGGASNRIDAGGGEWREVDGNRE